MLRTEHQPGYLPDADVVEPRLPAHVFVNNLVLTEERARGLGLDQMRLQADPGRVVVIPVQLDPEGW